jgi:hypothetical protein
VNYSDNKTQVLMGLMMTTNHKPLKSAISLNAALISTSQSPSEAELLSKSTCASQNAQLA